LAASNSQPKIASQSTPKKQSNVPKVAPRKSPTHAMASTPGGKSYSSSKPPTKSKKESNNSPKVPSGLNIKKTYCIT
jgi:hypothetical protein